MSKRTSRPRRRLQMEKLEDRSLMAASLVGGYLNVVGSNALNDTAVVVDTNPALPNSAVVVTLNGAVSVFNKAAFPLGIRFWGYGGDDSFTTNVARPVIAYGGDGNDTLHGGPAADQLYGGAGEDLINGHGGNDSIYGGTHNDTLIGGAGNDYITGQQGHDSILGGDGNDRLFGYTGNDTLRGGDGNDTLSGWDGADDLFGDAGNDKVYGHAGDDYLNGGTGNDTLSGGDGDDELVGLSGNDKLYGGDGDDDLDGGTGNDSLYGGDGNDTLHGGDGNDWMTGQAGHDVMYGGDGNDLMYGYTGNDTMNGGDGHDTLYGYTGNDLLIGGDGNDYLSGGDGNDRLYGREGNDSLYGGAGRDGLMGGNGVDVVNGGSDSDRYLTIGDHAEIVSMAGGDATIQFGGPQLWSYAEIETIDLGLARIHHRTGNTILLKDPDSPVPANPKAPRLFIERDDVSADGYSGEAHGNVLTMYDKAFDGSVAATEAIIIHEVAHMWDTSGENGYSLSGEDVVEYFRSLSGWRDDLGAGDAGDEKTAGGQTYVKAGSGTWWYAKDALFVTNYARKSPTEDFCETMSAVIMGSAFPFGSDPTAPVAKRAWINAWLNNV